jgi:hypothetical protein
MKKITGLLLLVFACLTVQGQTVTSDLIQGETLEGSFDARKTAKLTDVAKQGQFALRSPSARVAHLEGFRWIDRINNLPQYFKVFYDTYGEKVDGVLNGEENWLSDPTLGFHKMSDDSYSIDLTTFEGNLDFEFPADATKEQIAEYARNAVSAVCNNFWKEFNVFMPYLCMSLTYDYAKAFWLSSYFRWSTTWSYQYSYSSAGTGSIEYTQVMYFGLKAANYDYRHEDFRTQELVSSAVGEYKAKVKEIADGCPDDSRLSQILYFNNWLTKHNSYNSDFGHVDHLPTIVYSPLSALRGSTGSRGPVCESYSRAFKVLCEEKGIPCVISIGFAKNSKEADGEAHMWNEVQMGNTKWYAVDVTWNDPTGSGNEAVSGAERDFWILLGKKDMVGDNFTFEESHPANYTWADVEDKKDLWDVSFLSLIEDYNYATGVESVKRQAQPSSFRVFTLSGQYLGTFASPDELRRHARPGQLLMVNNRPCVVGR